MSELDRLRKKNGEQGSDLDQTLAQARKSGKFLAAVWYIDQNGKRQFRRFTSGFPVGEFRTAVEQLSDDLQEETMRAIAREEFAKAHREQKPRVPKGQRQDGN